MPAAMPCTDISYHLALEVDREEDGRWIAEVTDLPGVMAYGKTEHEAILSAFALALRVLADQIEEQKPEIDRHLSVSIRPR